MHSNQVADDNDTETEKSTSETSTKLTRKQFNVLACLMYNQFWAATCYSIQAPFFPEKATSKGATPTEYGMVFSVFELMIIIMSPTLGRMVPSISPKFLIVAGSFLEAGASVLFGVLDRIHGRTPFIVMAFLTRIVQGSGAAASMTASIIVIASEFPNARGRAFSLTEASTGVGLIVGPAIGGILDEAGGFLLPFVVCGGMLFIGVPLLILLIPSLEDTDTQEPSNFRKLLVDPGVQTHLFAVITTMVFFSFNAATLQPHLTKFNLRPAILSTIFVITGGVHALSAPVWGWFADKGVNSYSMMGLGYISTILGTFFIGPVPFIPFEAKLWVIIVSLIVISLGFSAKLIAALTGIVKIAPSLGFPDNLATYGMISGLVPMAMATGAFIGPTLGGMLLDTIGYSAGTCVILGLEIFFLSLLVALVLWRKRNDQSAEDIPILNTDR